MHETTVVDTRISHKLYIFNIFTRWLKSKHLLCFHFFFNSFFLPGSRSDRSRAGFRTLADVFHNGLAFVGRGGDAMAGALVGGGVPDVVDGASAEGGDIIRFFLRLLLTF